MSSSSDAGLRYQVVVSPAALKALATLEARTRRQVVRRIERLAGNPRPEGVVKLAGQEQMWRIRSGDYRIIFTIHDRQLRVLVITIGHRREIYRRR